MKMERPQTKSKFRMKPSLFLLAAYGLWLMAILMSIATKSGDDGTTGLLFNRRVSKDHPRIEACGSCDELNAALGMAKASLSQSPTAEGFLHSFCTQIHQIQKKLIDLMGELATLPEDVERYSKAGHQTILEGDVHTLTLWVEALEDGKTSFNGWSTPGASPASAALDMARVTCRRAERRIIALGAEARERHVHAMGYLNRLSDLLWLMGRKIESELPPPNL